LALLWFSGLSFGQEANSGFSVPVTITGEARASNGTDGLNTKDWGFRAVAAPAFRFGSHWFAYAALDAHSSAYFPYEFGVDNDRLVRTELMQAFAGYTTQISRASILLKAGQMNTAFGLYPVEYDDAKTPLIDPPLAYATNLPVRPDQLPCGVNDILRQDYDADLTYHCGGAQSERYGLTAATLYGLPAFEAEISLARFDGRVQITNSSPVNPHGLFSDSQYLQWSAGGGYAFRGGLHIGVSGFRGAYLDNNVRPWLPAGKLPRDYLATGIGIDARWSRGVWSAEGEWLHSSFELPGFVRGPSETAAYAELKRIISPRLFAAARVNSNFSGSMQDVSGVTATHAISPQQMYELTIGYRLNRQQLLKVGGTWSHYNAWRSGWYWPPEDRYAFELQLVNSFTPLSKAFR
jgi:hypothetical protein